MYSVDTKKDGLQFTFTKKIDALEHAKKNSINYIIDTSKNCKIDVARYNFIKYYNIYVKNNYDVINVYGSEDIKDIMEYLNLKSIKSIYKYMINNIDSLENMPSNIFIIKDYYIKD